MKNKKSVVGAIILSGASGTSIDFGVVTGGPRRAATIGPESNPAWPRSGRAGGQPARNPRTIKE
jgi:hypothetical protein